MLAYYASIGTFAGPKTPGSAYVLHAPPHGRARGRRRLGLRQGRHGGDHPGDRASGQRFGLEITTNARSQGRLTEGGRATGVVTATGDELPRADRGLERRRQDALCCKLVDRAAAARRVRAPRSRATGPSRPPSRSTSPASAPPQLPRLRHRRRRLRLSDLRPYRPDIDYLERAYDDAKHGWYSPRPFITPVVPTIVDDTLAPPGKHVVNLFGGHAPYKLKDGSLGRRAGQIRQQRSSTPSRSSPRASATASSTCRSCCRPTSRRCVGLPQGHIFQGELSPDQLFFQRPAPHYADYRTPIRGLYLCGSSTHPGGGVSGIPGHNAAREILKDRKRRQN